MDLAEQYKKERKEQEQKVLSSWEERIMEITTNPTYGFSTLYYEMVKSGESLPDIPLFREQLNLILDELKIFEIHHRFYWKVRLLH